MKIFKVSNFLFKVISRSWFLLLGIILSMFFLTTTYVDYVSGYNLGYINYIKSQEFALLSLVISSSASIIFGLNLKDESINYLVSNRFNYFISSLLASIKLGIGMCLIPLVYILTYIFTHKNMTISYISNGLFEFIFTFFFCIICTSILTTIICFFWENTLIRLFLCSIIIFITSSLNGTFGAPNKLAMIIRNIFNIHEDFDYSSSNNFLGFNHDIRYILDKLIVLFILIIILLIIAIRFYKKTKYLKFIKASILLFVVLTASIFPVLFNSFTLINGGGVFSYDDNLQQNILIEEYKMDLNFGYKLKNETNIKIKNNGDNKTNKISLLLDNLFNINSIKADGENLNFTHENNKINITLNKNLEKDSSVNLEINYNGRVNHINSTGYQYVIANSNTILLPIDSLAWYPSIKQDKEIKFDLNLNSKLDIKSNLNLNTAKNTLSGNSKSLFLIDGHLQNANLDGYEINFPLDTDVNNLSFDYLKKEIDSLNLSENQKKEITTKKRIIFAPIDRATNSAIQIVDGTIVFAT